jgi:nucleotide-binding universal stress UspA family protein
MNNNVITPGTIVAAVDGSTHALRAIQWAAAQAQLEGRPLALVHVTGHEGAPPTPHRIGAHEEPTWVDDSLRTSHLVLAEAVAVAEATRADIEVHGKSVHGEPRAVLADLSDSAHLLVLGSRGRGVLLSRLLGSISTAVAKTAQCPVVVTRPGHPGAIKDGIVVAADGTPESVPVVEFAFRQASLHAAPLTVMHCVYDAMVPVTGGASAAVVSPGAGDHGLLLAESVAGLSEKYPDVHVTQELARGLVADCLTGHRRLWNLIVVGRHPRHGLRWLTGSTAIDVMEHSKSVLAVVPEADPEPR